MIVNSVNQNNFVNNFEREVGKSEYNIKLMTQIADSMAKGEVPTKEIGLLIDDKVSDKFRDAILGALTFFGTVFAINKGVAPVILKKILPQKFLTASFSDVAGKIGDVTNRIDLSKITDKLPEIKNAKLQEIIETAAQKANEIPGKLDSSKALKTFGLSTPSDIAVLGAISVPAGVAAAKGTTSGADVIDDKADLKRLDSLA